MGWEYTPKLFSQNELSKLISDQIRNEKQFFKTFGVNGYCFNYTCRKFPKLSRGKLISRMCKNPKIRQLIKDTNLSIL